MVSVEEAIVRDLMKKLSDDVSAAVFRTLSLVGSREKLPIAMAAGGVCVGIVSGILTAYSGDKSESKPDADTILLAGLLLAHTGMGGVDPIGEAYATLALIKAEA